MRAAVRSTRRVAVTAGRVALDAVILRSAGNRAGPTVGVEDLAPWQMLASAGRLTHSRPSGVDRRDLHRRLLGCSLRWSRARFSMSEHRRSRSAHLSRRPGSLPRPPLPRLGSVRLAMARQWPGGIRAVTANSRRTVDGPSEPVYAALGARRAQVDGGWPALPPPGGAARPLLCAEARGHQHQHDEERTALAWNLTGGRRDYRLRAETLKCATQARPGT
jgi:hypothetical protein